MIGSGIRVSPAPWETERHRRGTIRWYDFQGAIQSGLLSAGSAATYGNPAVVLATAGATATPQNRAREAVEKQGLGLGTPIWTGFDANVYWGRPMRIQCFCVHVSGQSTPAGSRLRYGIFLGGIGIGAPPAAPLPVFPDPPLQPIAQLYYERTGVLDAPSQVETWKLRTGVGDGVTLALVSTLAGVQGPATSITPGGVHCQRLELVYVPGQYVAALIDGVEGARHTTVLPNPAFSPAASQPTAGVGVYIDQGQLNDACTAGFTGLMLENYRP